MSDNQPKNLGQQIGDTVRSALQSGDLSRLKDIGPAVTNAANNATKSFTGGQQNADENSPPPVKRQQPNVPEQQANQYMPQRPSWYGSSMKVRKNVPGLATGLPSIVFGGLGTVSFGALSLSMGIMALLGMSSVATGVMAGVFFVPFALCAGAIASGVGKRKLAARLRQYYTVLEQKNVRTFEELAVATGQQPEQIRKDLRKAHQKGLAPDLRIDALETCVMYGDEAYKLYLETEEARKKREAEEAERSQRMRDPSMAAMENFKAEGKATIRKIREANEALPGEEVSEKLDRLEVTCGKIFDYVQSHPDKLPDTRRFMDYYLPTTLKLLEKYKQYDQMDLPLQNVTEAKQEIEKTLDTIDVAFTNLLESLYHDDTLDVSTDIDVLKTMLAQEGLTGKKFQIDASDGDTQLRL